MTNKIFRVIGTVLIVTILDMLISVIAFMVIFKEPIEAITFARPADSPITTIGLPFSALYFGLMLTLVFYTFYKAIPGRGIMKALSFALIIWLFTAVSREFYTYLIYPVPFLSVVAGLIKEVFFLTAGSLVIYKLHPSETRGSSPRKR